MFDIRYHLNIEASAKEVNQIVRVLVSEEIEYRPEGKPGDSSAGRKLQISLDVVSFNELAKKLESLTNSNSVAKKIVDFRG